MDNKQNKEYEITTPDFFNLLKNSCENTENSQNNDSQNNYCLISNEPLIDNHIVLPCTHKFNYEPLFYEIKYQKTRKTQDNSKLLLNEIKCPYCRKIIPNILPYFKYYNFGLIRGVNAPTKYSLNLYNCEYILKTKNIRCNKCACKTDNGILCNIHYKCTNSILYDSNNLYSLKVNELKNILKKNNCKVGGKKQELIDRIKIAKSNSQNWIQ